VLVVVHEDDAVGVGGDLLEFVVRGGDGGVDVEAQVARVEVGVELLDEADVGRLGAVRQALEIEREAVVRRIAARNASICLRNEARLAGTFSTSP